MPSRSESHFNAEWVTSINGGMNMTIAELTEALEHSLRECRSEECAAFERLLNAELRSLACIEANDKRWQDELRAGTIQFSFAFEKELTQRYRDWVKNARLCLRQLELHETKECCPASAAQFRRSLDLAEETLLSRTQDEAAAVAALQDVE
jgi:hypothetical protein